MKKNFRIAALAVAACGLMVACNNNAPAELVDTVIPIDTTVVEELIDSMPVVDTPVVEQPVVKKAATPKKATTKKAEKTNTVSSQITPNTKKKSVEEVKDQLKEGEGNTTKAMTKSLNGKPNAADAFKKKN